MTKKLLYFAAITTLLYACESSGPTSRSEFPTKPKSTSRAYSSQDTQSESCNHDYYENQKILYIGDSHSYLHSKNGSRMGNKIINQLDQCGAKQIDYYGVCGSRPSNWMPGATPRSKCGVTTVDRNGFKTKSKGSTQNIRQLQDQLDPDIVIINLGDNMFSWKRIRGKTVAQIPSLNRVILEVKKLAQAVDSESECQWIGPIYHSAGKPYLKSNEMVDKLYQGIIEGLDGRCTIIDSRNFFTGTRPNDGLHLTEGESGIWGKKLSKEIRDLE